MVSLRGATAVPASMTFTAQASAMLIIQMVGRLYQTICAPHPAVLWPRNLLIPIGFVRAGEIELAHLCIVFPRRVVHEKGFSSVQRSKIVHITVEFF
jgi:hypothetical protein